MDLDDLYALIPDFICQPGCTECCKECPGPSRLPIEEDRIRRYVTENKIILPRDSGSVCPYVVSNGCAIHPVRPFICRLYGTSPNYPCRLGVKPVRVLHEDEEADLFRAYYEFMGRQR